MVFLDILIAGQNDYLLLNNGDNTFSKNETPFGIDDIASFSIGDANNDGFMDVYAHYSGIFTASSTPSKLFMNIGNGNNYFSVSLNGVTSNKNGIGAQVFLHGPWGKQTRIIKSGRGYGIANSLTARFGLDEETKIDSLIINWPSGIIDKYTDVNSNVHIVATEGLCHSQLINATTTGDMIDCSTESVEVSLDPINGTYLWSNGTTSESTIVNSYDHITAVITDEQGCEIYSQTIVIDTLESPIAPPLDVINDFIICESALPIEVTTTDGSDVLWHDESIDDNFSITESGEVFAIVENLCDTTTSRVVSVQINKPKHYR